MNTARCVLPPVSHLLATPKHTANPPLERHDESQRSGCLAHPHLVSMPYIVQDQPLKAKRRRASTSQLSVLNHVFSQTYFPSTELRIELGKQLGMSPRTVQIWFQNKRQSLRARERAQKSGLSDDTSMLTHIRTRSNHNAPKPSLVSPPLSPPYPRHSFPLHGPLSTCSSSYPSRHTSHSTLNSSPDNSSSHVTLPSLHLPALQTVKAGFPRTPCSSSYQNPTSIKSMLHCDY